MNARLLTLLAGATLLGIVAAVLLLQPDDRQGDAPTAPARAESAQPSVGRTGDDTRAHTDALLTAAAEGAPLPLEGETRVAVVEGRVIDRAGNPQAGATVAGLHVSDDGLFPRYALAPQSTQTDADGRFALVGLGTDGPVGVEVSGPGQAPELVAPFHLAPAQVRDLGDIVLKPGTQLGGTVTDEARLPLADVRVRVLDVLLSAVDRNEDRLVAEAVTGVDGTYLVPHLARRQYEIEASREGYATVSNSLSFALGSMPHWTEDFVLERADLRLGGRVLDPQERGVPDLGVHLSKRGSTDSGYFTASTTTDTQGAFLFASMPAGRFDLRIVSSDWYMDNRRTIDSGREDHVLRVHPALTVVGQLVAAGPPPARFTVTVQVDGRTGASLLGGSARTRHFDATQPPGRFRFGGLRPGAYTFEVQAPGHAVSRSQDLVLGPDLLEVEVAIPLRLGGTITGLLKPVADEARLELREGDWDPSLAIEDAFPTPPVHGLVTRPDETGRFRFEHVPVGSYMVTARAPGAPPTHRADVSAYEGEVTEIGTLELQRGGSIAGRVMGPDGRPSARATVQITGERHHQRTEAAVDGSFRLEAVPPGDYSITATPPDISDALRLHAQDVVSVRADGEAQVALVLSERRLQRREDPR